MFSSRIPFTDDPAPWIAQDLLGQDYPHRVSDDNGAPAPAERLRMSYRFAPRPEFDRPQVHSTNRVLADLRSFWGRHHTVKLTARHAAIYLLVRNIHSVLSSDSERAHSLEVLTRLGGQPSASRAPGGAQPPRERYTGVRALFNGDLHLKAPDYAPREDWIIVDAHTIEHVRPVGER